MHKLFSKQITYSVPRGAVFIETFTSPPEAKLQAKVSQVKVTIRQ